MKVTGITRRIDDLGRIIIPREIRHSLCIRDGDPLEIFTGDNNSIIVKKVNVKEGLAGIVHNMVAYVESDPDLSNNNALRKKLGEIEDMVNQIECP